MSTTGVSTPLACILYTEETDKCQAFNHELLAFPKLKKQETPVSPPTKGGWRRGKLRESQAQTACHLQYITFSKWSSNHATLPHSAQGQTLNLNEISLITSSHPHTHTIEVMDPVFVFFLTAKLESTAESVLEQQEVVRLLPKRHINAQRWRERPSVHVHIHLFHRFIFSICVTIQTGLFLLCDCVTGFYIIYHYWALMNKRQQSADKLNPEIIVSKCLVHVNSGLAFSFLYCFEENGFF